MLIDVISVQKATICCCGNTTHYSGVAGPLATWCGGQIAALLSQVLDKNSSGDEIANVNFYAVRPEATRIR